MGKKTKEMLSKHKCALADIEVQHELPSHPPYAPEIIKCVSNITRKWMVASRANPQSKFFIKSRYFLYQERKRQLLNNEYRMVIHPLSRFVTFYHPLIAVLWLYSFIFDPLLNSFLSKFVDESFGSSRLDNVQFALNFPFFASVVLGFFEGYVFNKTIILNQKMISSRYLTTYFIFDFVPIVYNLIDYILRFSKFSRIFLISQLYCLRFVRLPTMLYYFDEFLTYLHVSNSIIRCLLIVVTQMLIVHWFTCLFFLVPMIRYHFDLPIDNSWVIKTVVGSDRSILNIYLEFLSGITCHYFGAGIGTLKTRNPLEMAILSIILMCGCAVNIYVIAIILQVFGAVRISDVKYEELMYQVNEYLETKKFPPVLSNRIKEYYDYRFQKQFFKEKIILSSLSEHLRHEVTLYSCKNLLGRMTVLKDAPKEVLGPLMVTLKQSIYLPNDVITRTDEYNEYIYFISFGTVCVKSLDGKELAHCEDGSHFGEMSLMLNREVMKDCDIIIVAVEATEVFYVKQEIFRDIISEYPGMMDRLLANAEYKMALYRTLAFQTRDVKDIMSELRRGNILERGKPRI